MAKLPILEYPDARLREVSVNVQTFGPELHQFLDSMDETMRASEGIGLAAPQVDRRWRIFIIDLGLQPGYPPQKYEFINPRLSGGGGKIQFEEGCLSVPGLGEWVNRKKTITVDYQDRHGNAARLNAEGLLAVAIQHENDHLDGILFIDRLSRLKRLLAGRKLKKQITL